MIDEAGHRVAFPLAPRYPAEWQRGVEDGKQRSDDLRGTGELPPLWNDALGFTNRASEEKSSAEAVFRKLNPNSDDERVEAYGSAFFFGFVKASKY